MSRSVVHIVGARPQFVKAAVVIRSTRDTMPVQIIHTGQHYDHGLSDIFFDELDLPTPDFHLGVGSGSHGAQTGAMLGAIERCIAPMAPGVCVVYGDTNSTIAGALAAVKLGWHVVHVEAGLRSFDNSMPEEINRIAVDHMSHSLLCPTKTAVDQLEREGLKERATLVGDVMLDASLHAQERCQTHSRIGRFLAGNQHDGEALNAELLTVLAAGKPYAVATLHRAANTDDPGRLKRLIDGLGALPMTVLMPLHPRTRHAMANFDIRPSGRLVCVPPVGYLDFAALVRGSSHVITDSGGVQKEALFHGRPCTTMRDTTEWPETLSGDWNRLVDADVEALKCSVERQKPTTGECTTDFGNGEAGILSAQVIHSALATWN